MNDKQKKEFEALPTIQARAQWLLRFPVTAKFLGVIKGKSMTMGYVAICCGVNLPGSYDSKELAIAGGKAWLKQKGEVE